MSKPENLRSGLRSRIAAGAIALLGAALLAGPIAADSPDPLVAAKQAGYVGELPNGYLGIVDPKAPAEVKQLVARINEKRREMYEGVAEKTDVPVGQVEVVAGEKLRERAGDGLFVQDAEGNWVRKK